MDPALGGGVPLTGRGARGAVGKDGAGAAQTSAEAHKLVRRVRRSATVDLRENNALIDQIRVAT